MKRGKVVSEAQLSITVSDNIEITDELCGYRAWRINKNGSRTPIGFGYSIQSAYRSAEMILLNKLRGKNIARTRLDKR